jgi:hypothetical protein
LKIDFHFKIIITYIHGLNGSKTDNTDKFIYRFYGSNIDQTDRKYPHKSVRDPHKSVKWWGGRIGIAPVSRTGGLYGLVGSNPTPTANTTRCSVGFQIAERWFLEAVLVGVGEEPTANQ